MEGRETLATREPYVIAVGGGKGGVGKSVVALNLAVAMSQLGARVTALDADLGSANLHTMLGIDHPAHTLQALLDGRADNLEELRIETGIQRLSLIAGSVAVPGAANLQHARKLKLLRHISKLDTDVVVIDCGAGVHFNVIDFFARADLHLLVATPQLVSLQNAYGFLKACVYRLLQQRAQEAGKAQLFESASDHSEVETLTRLLERLAVNEPELVEELRGMLAACQFALLGNQLMDSNEANALRALSRMFGDFLNLQVPVLGCLLRRDRIHAAVTRRRPFVLENTDPDSKLLYDIADAYWGMWRSELLGRDPLGRAASPFALPQPTSPSLPVYAAPSGQPVLAQNARVVALSRAPRSSAGPSRHAPAASIKPLRRSM